MKWISFLSALLLLFLIAFPVGAIEFVVEMSPGATFYHPVLMDNFYKANTDVYMDLKMANNDGVTHTGYSQSHRFFAQVDGVETDGININWLDKGGEPGGTGPIVRMNGWEDNSIWSMLNDIKTNSWDGILPDSMNHTVATLTGWLATDTDLLTRFRFHFNIPLGGEDMMEFCIDSTNWGDPTWDWLFPDIQNFGGPYCFAFAPVPDMVVDTDHLFFQAFVDDVLPDQQFITLQKTGDMDYLDWSAHKMTSWLSIIPSSGTMEDDPVTIQVAAVTTSFPPGIYYDTIDIIAPEAGNSPIRIPVEYELLGQPPIIELSQTNFIFNAVAGSSNPPDQILSISNIGFSDLNWTVSNTESWLSLDPASGLNAGDVTLSIDITGLSYGFYYDSVIVSDPVAENNPQKAYIQLEISSALPVLEIDSTHIFVIANVDFPPDRRFNISNGGAGTMNYYLEEDGLHIVGLSPKSGSVPQEVTVEFKAIGQAGYDLYDTVSVYSDEAVNSPQFVEFLFHFTDDPAVIGVDKSSFEAEYYECGQGSNSPAADKLSLPILNIDDGGHEPFTFNITHTEDWLTLDKTTGDAPASIFLSYEYRGLAPGIYSDTLHISAINAINSPVRIPVTMIILESPEAPEIVVASANLPLMKFAAQVNKYGYEYWFGVNNQNPGCMDWEFSYLPSWLAVEIDQETSYPWAMWFTPSGYGISRGIYYDEIRIESSTASNSPHIINCEFSVFEFYGDANFDGLINILDVVHILNYLYKDGPPPQPITITGDCNCDGNVNIVDVVAILNYVYKGFDPLCGNPY